MAEIFDLVDGRRGHFLLESGLHSELWLDLESLFADHRRIAPFISSLSSKLRPYEIHYVCGALIGGALLGHLLALQLDVEFCYADQRKSTSPPTAGTTSEDLLFQARYELPACFQKRVTGKRVAIVDDVMSVGSALRGTYTAVRASGAHVVVAGALLVLGDKGVDYFAAEGIPVVRNERDNFSAWTPAECPLCARGVPLDEPLAAG